MPPVAQPPTQDSLIQQEEEKPARRDPFYMAKAWLVWILQQLLPRVNVTPEVTLSNKQYVNVNGAMGTTTIPTGVLSAGVYQVTYYLRKTVIDGGASSLQIILGWTENAGPALALTGAAMANDTTTDVQIGLIRVAIASNTALTFSTVVSMPLGNMRYLVQFSVMRLGSV